MAYIDISELPSHLRAAERDARERASDDSGFDIVWRSGFHGQPSDDPSVLGVVETRGAAEWFARHLIEMPDRRKLRPYAYRPYSEWGAGTFPANAPTDPAGSFARERAVAEAAACEALAESFADCQPYVDWR